MYKHILIASDGSELAQRAATRGLELAKVTNVTVTEPWPPVVTGGLAEGVGFEPTIRFPVYTLSKRAPSATRPSLRFRRREPAGCGRI